LHEDLATLEPRAPRHRRRQRREHVDARLASLQRATAIDGVVEEAIDVGSRMCFGNEQRDMRFRRQLRGGALIEQLVGEPAVVVRRQCLVDRMIGKVGLHDDSAREIGASGATRDLHQQRDKPFGCTKVGAVERIVGAEHADERKPGEVVSLGEHLRAHENIDFAGMNAGYAQFFTATHHKPARMTTRVAALVAPGALVEIEVQAAKAPGGP